MLKALVWVMAELSTALLWIAVASLPFDCRPFPECVRRERLERVNVVSLLTVVPVLVVGVAAGRFIAARVSTIVLCC